MRILRKCEVCGEEFIATKITNKYCSKRCARVVHRKKEAEKKKKARESKKDDAQNLHRAKNHILVKYMQVNNY